MNWNWNLVNYILNLVIVLIAICKIMLLIIYICELSPQKDKFMVS